MIAAADFRRFYGNICAVIGVQDPVSRVMSLEPEAIVRARTNAFDVLELSSTASSADVVAAQERLLAAIDRGEPGARSYATPLGARPRDAAAVRRAATTLLRADTRIDHEVWALLPAQGQVGDGEAAAGWDEADAAFGWRTT